MNFFKGKCILFLLFLFISCHSNNGQEMKTVHRFKQFPEEIQADVSFVTKLDVGRGMIISDSVIYFKNDIPQSSEIIKAFDLKSKESYTISKYGSNKGEFLGLMSFGLLNDTLWGYDITQRKISKIPLKDISKAEDYILDNWCYSATLLNNNKLLTTGGFDLKHRLRLYNDLSKPQYQDFVDYLPSPSSIPEDAWRLANESFLFYNEVENIAALAYRYSDKVEFIDLDSKSNIIKFGPYCYEPKFDVISQNERNLIQRNNESKFAFNGIGFTSDRYFYLSICNHQHENLNKDLGNEIYIYSAKGDPIMNIKLPFYISGISVLNDKEVFVFAPEERSIYKFNITFNE